MGKGKSQARRRNPIPKGKSKSGKKPIEQAENADKRRQSNLPRLLLLSCSRRKSHTFSKIPALDRYDGPAFQVLRRYLRENVDPQLQIWILSAKHGLISGGKQIADYDRKMDSDRAVELRGSSVVKLKNVLREREYMEVFVCTSRIYLNALPGIQDLHPKVSLAAPGQGKKLASLRWWLWGGQNDC